MPSLGSKIDELFDLREKYREADKQAKELKAQLDDLESEIIDLMDKEGTTTGATGKASVSITESIRPTVEDWDQFYAFLHRRKAYHLLERRPSVSGCRELFETKGSIPGVTAFKKRVLNLRTK
jgi:hypothetical protein